MNKKLTAVAVAAALAAPAAFAEATIYGNLHTSLGQYNLEIDGVGYDDDLVDNWDVIGEDGQLGIQGSEDLGGGLTALYKVEFNLDPSGGSLATQSAASPALEWDEVWIGFTGDWGTALIGREDTPYKTFMDSAGVDILGDSIVDVDDLLKNVDPNQHAGFERFTANGAIAYVSPNFSGFTFGAAIIPGGQSESASTSSPEDGIADHYSIGANYVGGGLRVAAGYESKAPLDGSPSIADEDQDNWGIGASYTFGGFMVGAKYEEEDNVAFFDNEDSERWAISGKYTFGNNEIGVIYVDEERETDGGADDFDADGWGVFAAHNLSPRTKIYAAYADADADGETTSPDEDFKIDAGEYDTELSAFSLGVIHSF